MWQLKEEQIPFESIGVHESLYTLGNGYLGVRGFFDEGIIGSNDSIRGCYINGVYERIPMEFGERAVGFPEMVDKQPKIMDSQSVTLFLDDELVLLTIENTESYSRFLDFKRGILEKSYHYRTKSGKVAKISTQKMISFREKHLCLQKWQIDFPGDICLTTQIDGRVSNYVNANDPRVGQDHAQLLKAKDLAQTDEMMYLALETKVSQIVVACGSSELIEKEERVQKTFQMSDNHVMRVFKTTQSLSIDQFTYVIDSRVGCAELAFVTSELHRLKARGVTALFEEQRLYMEAFWKESDIEIFGNVELQLAIRFNLFQLLQSVGKDGVSNLSAKGLSGEGYEGHYFWDTEIYALPLLCINQPDIAKGLLEFRHHQLPEARAEAMRMGHEKGAKFPWRTISGVESSGYFPAGTAQYHINADVAYGVILYNQMTDDKDFLMEKGLEILVETSRFWMTVGQWIRGRFRINCVTGPDEYTALVDNNFYTNGMAQHQLLWTGRYLRICSREKPSEYEALLHRLMLTEEEVEGFEQAAEGMYLPRDLEEGIDLQDDQFMNRAPWPFERIDESQYPLLLHYHPLIIYRHQVLKQADTVLAHLMLPHISDLETMKKSFHFYEALTTHDSSLSSCVYGTMAARLGEKEKAWRYFLESVDIDLKNTHGNTKDGLHMANLAGSCLTVLQGFAGLSIDENGIRLAPWVPEDMTGYRFKILYRGERIAYTVVRDGDQVRVDQACVDVQNLEEI